MVKLQPYNQGEYICDAYVIIDEENATAHVRNIDNGINFDIENLNRVGGILSPSDLKCSNEATGSANSSRTTPLKVAMT